MSSVAETFRVPARRRAAGWAAALGIEALLVLALLTLGDERVAEPTTPSRTVTFDLSPDAPPAPSPTTQQPKAEERERQQEEVQPSQPQPNKAQPAQAAPVPPAAQPTVPPPLIELPRGTLPSADIRMLPQSSQTPKAVRRPAGPPSDSRDADTPVVGTAPNGERLYAAAWYREPYDDELRGYLSTADPGWALIACKTVPDFRVDDCVALDEYPAGSRMARAVLAAAWQFRVRPPQLGGQLKVGEWVRIRIDYSLRRTG